MRKESVHLIRNLPPSSGDMIHLSDCRYAKKSVRWKWADDHTWEEWANIPWLKYCRVCKPREALKPISIIMEEITPI